jgi:hypothetical protein
MVVGLVASLTACGSSTPPSPPSTTPTTAATATPYGPTALDAKGLKAAVRSLGQFVFWVGPEAGHSYELQRTANGDVFVRYLPAGVKPGDKRQFPTIGTYRYENAYAGEVALSKRSGWTVLKRTRWLAVYRDARPTSVYLTAKAFPYQIEVYDPSAAQARAVVRSGRVTSVR